MISAGNPSWDRKIILREFSKEEYHRFNEILLYCYITDIEKAIKPVGTITSTSTAFKVGELYGFSGFVIDGMYNSIKSSNITKVDIAIMERMLKIPNKKRHLAPRDFYTELNNYTKNEFIFKKTLSELQTPLVEQLLARIYKAGGGRKQFIWSYFKRKKW